MRGKRTEAEMDLIWRDWKDKLYDYEFRDLSFIKQAAILDVSPATVTKWFKELSPANWENIKKVGGERIAPQTVKINDALYKKCLEGDVAAIKLWKESMEGWVPRQDMGLSRARDKELDAMDNEELVKIMVKDWPQDKKQKLLGDSSMGAGEPHKESTVELLAGVVVEGADPARP